MALFNFSVNYCSSVKYAAIAAWQASHAYAAGAVVRRTVDNIGNANIFFALGAGGTSGATEPSWSNNRGQLTTDNTVSWIEMGGQPAMCGDLTNTARWSTVRNQGVDTGNIIKDASNNIFIVSVSGSTNNTAEPSWNTGSVGATTTDGSATWTFMGPSSNFAAWQYAHACIRNALSGGWSNYNSSVWLKQCYVSHDHAFSLSGNSYNTSSGGQAANPFDVICVNSAGSVPPVTADLRTTATETVTNNQLTVSGNYRIIYGVTFNAGGNLILADTQDTKLLASCGINITTGGGSTIQVNSGGCCRLQDCTMSFGSTSQAINGNGRLEMIGGSIGATGSIPSSLLSSVGTGAQAFFQGVDLSALASTTFVGGNVAQLASCQILDCKMPSSYTLRNVGSDNNRGGSVTTVSRSNNASATVDQMAYADMTGTITDDLTVVRTGGALGIAALSCKMVTTANINSGAAPLQLPVVQYNPTTGANVNVTVYGIIDAAAVPTLFEAYLDVEYFGTSGNTLGSHKSTHPSDYLLSTAVGNATADTSSWDSAATARVNSHTYAAHDVIALASNPGRLFFCQSGGAAASSEPGGYATAIDGGSVTDGAATFRAGCRFSLTLTLTSPQPQVAGNLNVLVNDARPSSTMYIDPLLVLS